MHCRATEPLDGCCHGCGNLFLPTIVFDDRQRLTAGGVDRGGGGVKGSRHAGVRPVGLGDQGNVRSSAPRRSAIARPIPRLAREMKTVRVRRN
jgi:hypothetical protein